MLTSIAPSSGSTYNTASCQAFGPTWIRAGTARRPWAWATPGTSRAASTSSSSKGTVVMIALGGLVARKLARNSRCKVIRVAIIVPNTKTPTVIESTTSRVRVGVWMRSRLTLRQRTPAIGGISRCLRRRVHTQVKSMSGTSLGGSGRALPSQERSFLAHLEKSGETRFPHPLPEGSRGGLRPPHLTAHGNAKGRAKEFLCASLLTPS